MTDIDPLDVGLVLAIPAFIGIVGSHFYTVLILLWVSLAVGFVLFGVWAFYSATRELVGEVIA